MLAMLDRGGAKGGARGGAWQIDIEKLKEIKGCTSTDKIHRHTPFANLVTNLPGLSNYVSITITVAKNDLPSLDVAEIALDHCVSTTLALHAGSALIAPSWKTRPAMSINVPGDYLVPASVNT